MRFVPEGYFSSPEDNITPGVVSLANALHRKPYSSGEHRNPNWVLDYSLTPCGSVRVGSPDSPYKPRPGGIGHLYAPRTSYWEESPESALPSRSCYIVFRGGEALGFERFFTGEFRFARITDDSRRLERIICPGVGKALHGGYFQAQIVLYQVAGILQSLRPGDEPGQWVLPPEDSSGQTADSDWLREAKQYLQSNISRKVTLDSMAHAMNCSKSTLVHRYRSLSGETVWQTLVGLRINAASILLSGGKPLKEVALQTGFYDEFHLSKCFKQHTGQSPREFTRKIFS